MDEKRLTNKDLNIKHFYKIYHVKVNKHDTFDMYSCEGSNRSLI